MTSRIQTDFFTQTLNASIARKNGTSGRVIEFLEKDHEAAKELGKIVGIGAGSFAVIGGIIGGTVGGVCGSPGGPPGVAIGAVIGIPVGAAIGSVISTCYGAHKLYPRYEAWLETIDAKEFAIQIPDLVNKRADIQHLLCGVGNIVVVDAVRTPNGQLYNRSSIERSINEKGCDPLTRQPLSLKDLTPDEDATIEAANLSIKAAENKKNRISNADISFIPGIDAFIKDQQEALMTRYNRSLLKLEKEWKEDKLSHKEFREKTLELSKKYFD